MSEKISPKNKKNKNSIEPAKIKYAWFFIGGIGFVVCTVGMIFIILGIVNIISVAIYAGNIDYTDFMSLGLNDHVLWFIVYLVLMIIFWSVMKLSRRGR